MDRDQIDKIVRVVIYTMLKHPYNETENVTRENTPDWDSLKHIEIMFALEDELGVEFTEKNLVELNSINNIVDMVLSKHAA